jgi:hypothetical protein
VSVVLVVVLFGEVQSLGKRKPQRRRGSLPSGLSVRRTTDGQSWVFAHPRCARDTAEDLEEVRLMVDAGEHEIAQDELRWLLSDCAENVAAHVLLGELAMEAGDFPLARGHYGAGYQLGLQTLRRAGMPKPLLYSQPANRAFFEAGQGLAGSLEKLGKSAMANEIVSTLLELDPSDPLRLRAMVDALRTGGVPVVSLELPGRAADTSNPRLGETRPHVGEPLRDSHEKS